jgi:hypothetical protein
MRYRKAAIELSANFLVVIIISIVIMAGGLALFFKLTSHVEKWKDTMDKQSEERIRSLMLSNNYKVALYPNSLELSPDKGELVGIGISNELLEEKVFLISVDSVKYFATSESTPQERYHTPPPINPSAQKWTNDNIKFMSPDLKIPAKDFRSKNFLVIPPKGSMKGQYVVTLQINYRTPPAIAETEYGKLQVFVTVK